MEKQGSNLDVTVVLWHTGSADFIAVPEQRNELCRASKPIQLGLRNLQKLLLFSQEHRGLQVEIS